ncbi:cytochrome P450 [soil metagenome]
MTIEQSIPTDFFDPRFVSNPYPIYQEWRDHHPLIWHEAMDAYVITRYEDVSRAFKEFSSENYAWQLEPVIGRSILQMEGLEHSKQRALVTPAFRGQELKERFVPVIQANAEALIEGFRLDSHVDLVEQFTKRFPIGVIVDMLGLPPSDHGLFHGWYSAMMAFLSNVTQDPEVTAAGLRTTEELRAYMAPIIDERRINPGDDMLSVLCTAEIDGVRMTDAEIKAFTGLLLIAGGETSDKAMASMFKNLVNNPDQLQAVREDRSLIERAFAETLRYSPPVRVIMRTVKVDTELSGGLLKAGKSVACVIGAANTDDRQYSDPNVFNIFRDDLDIPRAYSAAANHVAFCGGRHFCVGAQLAKAEAEIGANLLLDAMEDMRFPDGYTPTEEGLFSRAPSSLLLDFRATAGALA